MKQEIKNNMHWILRFIRKNGVLCYIQHIFFLMFHMKNKDYNWWRKKNNIQKRDLVRQKKSIFELKRSLRYK